MKKLFLFSCILFLLTPILQGQDLTLEVPDLEFVTVINEQGHVELNWTYSEPDSIDGFIIYYYDPTKDPAPSIPFATVYDSLATNYIDGSGKANSSSVSYTIAAFKEFTDTTVTSKLTEPHFTIYQEKEWEECDDAIMLNWNKYIGWDDDSIFYDIYENGVLIERTIDTFYINIDAENNVQYQYVVVAVNKNSGLTSRSNVVSQKTTFPISTEFINADFASVNDESIYLSFTLGLNGSGYDYILLSKPPGSSDFSDTLTTFDYSNMLDYNYLTSNVLEQYQFKLREIDRCGRTVKESNISSNIVLEGEKQDNTITLNWTEYLDWLGGVDSYRIYRNAGNGFEEIRVTDNLSFNDDVTQFINDEQVTSISYYIEAVEGSGNPNANEIYYSRSNTIEIFLENKLKFPTAITPNDDGVNDIFHPFDLVYIPTEYQLIVFDRWGKKVFESKQVGDGWDGKFKSGKNVTEGVYHYYSQYKDPEGNEISQKGIVTVIYP
jgi:gliding motility-associated-like protein